MFSIQQVRPEAGDAQRNRFGSSLQATYFERPELEGLPNVDTLQCLQSFLLDPLQCGSRIQSRPQSRWLHQSMYLDHAKRALP